MNAKKIQLIHHNGFFFARCTFDAREIPRTAGFRWDASARMWYTTSPGVAHRLVEYADERAKKEINRTRLVVSAWTGAIPHPKNLTPLPFQKNKVVSFALSRNRSYVWADPGLGKTICAALIRNAIRWPALYLCPPGLIANVLNEFEKWSVGEFRVTQYEKNLDPKKDYDLVIVPDSLLLSNPVIRYIHDWFLIREGKNTLLFVDEAHRYKNATTGRTKQLLGHRGKTQESSEDGFITRATKTVLLSGTAMPNRPIELFPVLNACAPETIGYMNKHTFGVRYCDAKRGSWGWDYSGASNTEELFSKISNSFFLRVRKQDVLPDLPARLEEAVLLDGELSPTLLSLDKKILKENSPIDLMKKQIGEEHVATYRRLLGEEKIKPALKYIRYLLEEDPDECLLVFAHHKAVISGLYDGLNAFNPLVISGDVPTDKRQEIANRFQSPNGPRVMILNIQAGGIGFNLTRASRVVFVEYSWVPSDNDQAIDRAHRIGQTKKVLSQYLVFKNSLDRSVLETALDKRRIIQKMT